MPCERRPWLTGNGTVGTMIVCTKGRRRRAPPCSRCGRPAGLLCDGPRVEAHRQGDDFTIEPMEGGRTCDAPICGLCATTVGLDRHLCPRCNGGAPSTAPPPIKR